jgi:putative (di)nucleoside polyphosphate hydrolase
MSTGPAYRPCVGIALFNREGLVFIGRRLALLERGEFSHPWQMPQGGIDAGETPEQAAIRELYEETNVRSVAPLGAAGDWFSYDLPAVLAEEAWRGRFRGQAQRWFAFRFDGDDKEIDVARPGGGHAAEFDAWRWEKLERVPLLVVPFKRAVYERVVAEFRKFTEPNAAELSRPRA